MQEENLSNPDKTIRIVESIALLFFTGIIFRSGSVTVLVVTALIASTLFTIFSIYQRRKSNLVTRKMSNLWHTK